MTIRDDFVKAVYEAMDNDAYSLSEGGASSFDDYRHRVGIRKGLKRALQIMEDVVEESRKRDDKF